MASEVVLALALVGAFHERSKLMHVAKGAQVATFHGRQYRRTSIHAFKGRDRVAIFEPDPEG